MSLYVRDANDVVGIVTHLDADLTYAIFQRKRSDGSCYRGEECHLTKELTVVPSRRTPNPAV